jgi:hypothetical protein
MQISRIARHKILVSDWFPNPGHDEHRHDGEDSQYQVDYGVLWTTAFSLIVCRSSNYLKKKKREDGREWLQSVGCAVVVPETSPEQPTNATGSGILGRHFGLRIRCYLSCLSCACQAFCQETATAHKYYQRGIIAFF